MPMVPIFTKFFYPVLKFLSDGSAQNLKSAQAYAIDFLHLSEEDQQEKTKSGRTTRVYDRVQWALTYLKAAGLVASPKRGLYAITDKGRKVLASGITELNQKYLCDISPEFKNFLYGKKGSNNSEGQNATDTSTEMSPSETIDTLVNQLNNSLASDLLEQVKKQSPSFFEQLVIDLLVKMGYGGNREDAATVTKMSHDGGIDGIIKEDRLGLDKIYVQAKRWENTVQKPEIQKFRGALSERGATKGIFITTSDFSIGAQESARNAKIVLIDGTELCRLMIEFGIGVSVKTTYEIKRIDTDYFHPED